MGPFPSLMIQTMYNYCSEASYIASLGLLMELLYIINSIILSSVSALSNGKICLILNFFVLVEKS